MYTPGMCDFTSGNGYKTEQGGLEVLCLEKEKKVKAFSHFLEDMLEEVRPVEDSGAMHIIARLRQRAIIVHGTCCSCQT